MLMLNCFSTYANVFLQMVTLDSVNRLVASDSNVIGIGETQLENENGLRWYEYYIKMIDEAQCRHCIRRTCLLLIKFVS